MKSENNYEIRSFGGNAAPRLDGERTIEGYAIVFDQESRVMFDAERRRYFIEIIEPGAVSNALIQSCDIKALVEHNRERLLARSRMGQGSMTLTIDPHGMAYRFELPHTRDGEYVLEGVRRGDLPGSSFAYLADEKEGVAYERRPDGMLLRRVKRIERLFDVSVVSDPAYWGTEVNVRSLERYFDNHEDDTYLREINELRNLINQ